MYEQKKITKYSALNMISVVQQLISPSKGQNQWTLNFEGRERLSQIKEEEERTHKRHM